MTQVDETVVTEAADEAANDVTAEVTEGGAEGMQAAATDAGSAEDAEGDDAV